MSKQEIISLMDETDDEFILDELYDELDRRQLDLELRDYREDDYWAAQSDRLELFMNEY